MSLTIGTIEINCGKIIAFFDFKISTCECKVGICFFFMCGVTTIQHLSITFVQYFFFVFFLLLLSLILNCFLVLNNANKLKLVSCVYVFFLSF